MDPILVFNNINFAYETETAILKDVSFTVSAGEFLGVIGPNGGGKTTLLKLIIGLLAPTSGTIEIFGKEPKLARQEIGYVPQFSTFNRDFPISVLNVVLTGLLGTSTKSLGYTKEEKKIALECLDNLGISHLQKLPIRSLSGGQMQKVMIARAIASKPKLLLLDEPTANIDIHGEENVFDLLAFLNHNITIMVVSHDIGFISRYINKVVCINRSLLWHQTAKLTPELIEKLYGVKVKIIKHD